MSIQTEIDRIKTGIASAYAALAEKGIASTGGVDELGELIGSIEGRNAEVFTFTPASDTTTFSIENPYGITDKCFVFLLSTNKNQKQREILFQAAEFFKKNVYYPSKCYEIRRNTTSSATDALDGRTSFKSSSTYSQIYLKEDKIVFNGILYLSTYIAGVTYIIYVIKTEEEVIT